VNIPSFLSDSLCLWLIFAHFSTQLLAISHLTLFHIDSCTGIEHIRCL